MSESPMVINLTRALAEHGEILTPQEIADALKLNEDTITNWLANGTLRGFKLGRVWRVVREDFLEDMATRYNVQQPTGPTAGDDPGA